MMETAGKAESLTLGKKQKIFDCVLIFLICFVPRMVIILQAYPVATVSDEVSALHIAASVAGYDWSDVVSNAGYYGIGFLWIFAPLFRIGLSPVVIYRVILSVLAGINALTGPLFYAIMGRFFHVQNRFGRVVVSGICGALIFFFVPRLSSRNEEILAFLVCLVVFLMCRIVQERKFRDEIWLCLVMLYALTCHTRAVAILLAVLAVSILYSIFYRKKLLHIATYIISIAGYVAVYYLLNFYRAGIWGSGAVRNSSVSSNVGNSLSSILATGDALGVIKTWVKIVGGQIFAGTTFSGGLFLIATIVCLLYLFYFLKQKKENCSEALFVLSLLALILVYFTIFTQGVTWLPGVYNNIYVEENLTYVTQYRAFTYTRYFGVYAPMLIMTAFCIWEQDKTLSKPRALLKKSAIAAVPCYLLLLFLWVRYILVLISTHKHISYYLLAGITHNHDIQTWNWVMFCILGTSLVVLYLIMTRFNRVGAALVVSLVLLVSEQIDSFQNDTVYADQTNYEKVDAGYALIQDLNGVLGEDIYVYDQVKDSDDQIFYLYQLYNYTYHIIPGMPEDIGEDFILFTNKPIEFDDETIDGYQLDDNEYVYTNVVEYKERLHLLY